MQTDDQDDVKDGATPEEEATPRPEAEPEVVSEGDGDADVGADTGEDPQAGELLDETPIIELAPAVDPRDARIAELEASLRDAQARLRAVSKAFTDQKEEMSAVRDRIEARAKAREALQGFEAVKAFFDPVQNLQRSIEVGASDPDAFAQGIQMVHKQFQAGLDRLGLERVPGVGAHFDPNIHEALAVMPVPEESQDGLVLMVHVDGYMVAGKPIQAAQVVIGKYTTPKEPEPEPEEAAVEKNAEASDD
jgi:molecular chaperone GrpE